ncbi:GNAT family N-acetyltransferase [Microlunatus flavus]|uniref:Acetyltransferase (GNAT) family protein n=1 Tax=Microlunatus flavus TaxID=1036181 RepID=A0A1H9L6F9_9ACTN|nr:GNAT family N-acetyltransferase [Microlunatus flavus]SER06819.1 Acetyltransferase (GNAT) family protein [Microlunatus flavus]
MEIVDLPAGDARWGSALPVLQELRPHLTAASLQQVLRDGAPQGLRFTAVFDADRCLGVAGWRVVVNTSALRKLYVDDLCTTTAARSNGVGAVLLGELRARALSEGCHVLDLDSGVQRHAAHRFYLRERLDITSFHFAQRLG